MNHARTNAADAPRVWQDADGTHIDVRNLAPPEPMTAILRLLEGRKGDAVLIAHLDREPIFLYPELDERGWDYEILPSACGDPECEHEVRLRLVRLRP